MSQIDDLSGKITIILMVHDENKKQAEARVKKTENYSASSVLKEIEDCRKNFADKAGRTYIFIFVSIMI